MAALLAGKAPLPKLGHREWSTVVCDERSARLSNDAPFTSRCRNNQIFSSISGSAGSAAVLGIIRNLQCLCLHWLPLCDDGMSAEQKIIIDLLLLLIIILVWLRWQREHPNF